MNLEGTARPALEIDNYEESVCCCADGIREGKSIGRELCDDAMLRKEDDCEDPRIDRDDVRPTEVGAERWHTSELWGE